MTITTEEWMQHRRDGLTDALIDRGYPNHYVRVTDDGDGWLKIVIRPSHRAELFVSSQPDHGQAYRDGLAYINSLPQMEVA